MIFGTDILPNPETEKLRERILARYLLVATSPQPRTDALKCTDEIMAAVLAYTNALLDAVLADLPEMKSAHSPAVAAFGLTTGNRIANEHSRGFNQALRQSKDAVLRHKVKERGDE